jgi:lipopolysaccharide export system protein LptA
MKRHLLAGLLIVTLYLPHPGLCQEKKEEKPSGFILQNNQKNLPTYIKSDTLTLKSEERVFQYSGNVEVKQGDFTLTSDILDGKYDANNKIQELVARQNVVIIKGENIRGHGERATYDAATETVVITENPELQQNDSVLTADLIRIFLKENRSTAEGAVRVKLVNDKKENGEAKDNNTDIKSLLKK